MGEQGRHGASMRVISRGGPIAPKPVIPGGKRYWIAIAWLWPAGGTCVIRHSLSERPTLEPAPKALACCWRRGGQDEVDRAWKHMEKLYACEASERCNAGALYWAVYATATTTELFGRGRGGRSLQKVRDRITQEWNELSESAA